MLNIMQFEIPGQLHLLNTECIREENYHPPKLPPSICPISKHFLSFKHYILFAILLDACTRRQTDRERQTDRHTWHAHTYIQTDRQTDSCKQTDTTTGQLAIYKE